MNTDVKFYKFRCRRKHEIVLRTLYLGSLLLLEQSNKKKYYSLFIRNHNLKVLDRQFIFY
jgi:hypothetical protein